MGPWATRWGPFSQAKQFRLQEKELGQLLAEPLTSLAGHSESGDGDLEELDTSQHETIRNHDRLLEFQANPVQTGLNNGFLLSTQIRAPKRALFQPVSDAGVGSSLKKRACWISQRVVRAVRRCVPSQPQVAVEGAAC